MKSLKQALNVRTLIVLGAVLGLVLGARAWRAGARAAAERALFVPVIVSPSVQAIEGQSLLFKATNLSDGPLDMRLTLFKDGNGLPLDIKDFSQVKSRTTVTYLYTPPPGTLVLSDRTVQIPEAIRVVFGPLPAGDQNTIRSVVASLHLLRVQPAAVNASSASVSDPLIFVPLERCQFEPRGFVPYQGARWIWNCAPETSLFAVPPRT